MIVLEAAALVGLVILVVCVPAFVAWLIAGRPQS